MSVITLRATSVLPRWAGPAAAAGVALAACTVAGVADPTRPGSGLPACPFKTVTGYGCPGCGSTRMLHMLVHGDVVAAARYNVVALLMVPVLGWLWLRWSRRSLGMRPLPIWRPSPRTLQVAIALWMVYSVLRNLPWEPFSALNV